jgi:hypothetical protein
LCHRVGQQYWPRDLADYGVEQLVGDVIADDAQAQYIIGPYEVIELDAGHWLMEDHPRVVPEAIIQHLQAVEQ